MRKSPQRKARGGGIARPGASPKSPEPRTVEPERHAPDPVFPAGPAGDAGRGADRQPPADAARRDDPAGERRHLFVAAARLQGAAPDRADRPRGAAARRAHPAPDADAAVGRPLARERALRRLRRRDAADQGPPRARHALRADQRGADHRHLPLGGDELQGAAADALPHPVEVPRRGAAALRGDARARVPDEGRLQLRPDRGRTRCTPTTGTWSATSAPTSGWG